jgi:hypothetical protein
LLEEYHIVVNCIPDLLYLQELKMRCFFSWRFSDNQLSTFKTQVLSAMAKNVSIVDAYISLMINHSSITWTEEEQDQFQSLKKRNSTCSKLLESPDVTLWPHLFQSVPTSNAGATLIFQSLRELSANLSFVYHGSHK